MALRRIEVGGFDDLGKAELVEPTYGQVKESGKHHKSEIDDRLLGTCLLIDGKPIGFERLRALPYREKAKSIVAASTALLEIARGEEPGKPRD